jgi:hypothetical protein
MENKEENELDRMIREIEDFEKKVAVPEIEKPLYDNRSNMSVAEFSKINKPLRVGLRHLHRAWSAAVDGFPKEAKRARDLGMSEIKEARLLLDESLRSKKEGSD